MAEEKATKKELRGAVGRLRRAIGESGGGASAHGDLTGVSAEQHHKEYHAATHAPSGADDLQTWYSPTGHEHSNLDAFYAVTPISHIQGDLHINQDLMVGGSTDAWFAFGGTGIEIENRSGNANLNIDSYGGVAMILYSDEGTTEWHTEATAGGYNIVESGVGNKLEIASGGTVTVTNDLNVKGNLTMNGTDLSSFYSASIHAARHAPSGADDVQGYYSPTGHEHEAGDLPAKVAADYITFYSATGHADAHGAGKTDDLQAYYSPTGHTHDGETIVVADHGTAATDEVVNVSYGTATLAPTASTTTEGSIYITYEA